jgi:hypothetical protein
MLFTWTIQHFFSACQNLSSMNVFRAQADCTFILPWELSAKELRQLPTKMPQHGTT